jgi:hypothetical protein
MFDWLAEAAGTNFTPFLNRGSYEDLFLKMCRTTRAMPAVRSPGSNGERAYVLRS